jgi:hypothetical protein
MSWQNQRDTMARQTAGLGPCQAMVLRTLDRFRAAIQTERVNATPARRRSTSAPYAPRPELASARERILRALELGLRAQVLRRLGDHARSRAVDRPR